MIRLTLAVLLLLAPVPALAEGDQAEIPTRRVAEVVESLKTGQDTEATFAASFIAQLPPAAFAQIIRKIEDQAGKLIGAEDIKTDNPTTVRFTLRFERALAATVLTIDRDAPHKVTGLRIISVTPLGDSLKKIAADFAALPGRSGFAVVKLDDHGSPVTMMAAHADDQFAIGSTFKLWVLDALAEEIAAGRHRWDEVVPLGPRSLPSGISQQWPSGMPVTVETLATLMISMSDNTASDTLIRLIGRDRIAQRVRATGHSAPSRMLPFLTTAEAFALKLSPPDVRDAYAKADDATQARLLAGLDARKVLDSANAAAPVPGPIAIDSIEWFASSEDIARVLDSLRRRTDPRVQQILSIAPGLPNDLRQRFGYVGYKGGSEAGVISQSWLIRTKAGSWIVVTASWNDPGAPLDNDRFGYLAQRLVRIAALGS